MTMLKENGSHWLIIDGSLGNVLISEQLIFNSIPESKIAHDQCVRKQMTELVVICKPPQYRKAPPLKWDPRPPQRSPHKLTTPNNQTRQAQLFPITKLKALPPKSVLLNQVHTLIFLSLSCHHHPCCPYCYPLSYKCIINVWFFLITKP